MLKRYIFPIILIIAGIAGVYTPKADFAVFAKLGQILPKSILIAPVYQMVFGLVAVIGVIGIIEVFVTTLAKKAAKNGKGN